MMAATFNGNPRATIISCYSPTNVSEETELVTFYDELSSLVRSIPKHNMLVIGGDMNAQIGKNRNWHCRLIFHFFWAKIPWKEPGLISTLRMTALWCLKRKFHWEAHRLDITTSRSPNLYQTKVSSNTYFSLKKSLRTSQKKLKLQRNYIDNLVILVVKKLCDLVKNAGIRDAEFIKILQVLPNSCEVCIHYKKTEPRPIVRFTLGPYFNENIAMDIKEINGNKVLHLIDHATRYSVGVRIPSNGIFKHWITSWDSRIYPDQ